MRKALGKRKDPESRDLAKAFSLRQLIASPTYTECLRWHAARGEKIEKSDGPLDFSMRAVQASGLSIRALSECLQENPRLFNVFVAAKLKKYEGRDDEEYPPGEEPGPDERPKTLQVLDSPKDFLVVHLIEFTILCRAPKELEGYVKRRRIPHVKRYAKEVLGVFQRTRG
jgi:hypothetical protein